MKPNSVESILDDYSAKLIHLMRLEKDAETAVIKSDVLQTEAAQVIKDLYSKDKIILIGHIEKESDFWVTVHLPNSGMILDLKKSDFAEMRKNI